MSAIASSRQAVFKSERISSKSADAAEWMQCAQNLRNPARARRAGAMRWMFHTAKLGKILFSRSKVQNPYLHCWNESVSDDFLYFRLVGINL